MSPCPFFSRFVVHVKRLFIYIFTLPFSPPLVSSASFQRMLCYDCRVNESCAALTAKDAPMMRPRDSCHACAESTMEGGGQAEENISVVFTDASPRLHKRARDLVRVTKKIILKHINFFPYKGGHRGISPTPGRFEIGGSTFVKICIRRNRNNGISGLKCLFYISSPLSPN